jgi:hypothetical protein
VSFPPRGGPIAIVPGGTTTIKCQQHQRSLTSCCSSGGQGSSWDAIHDASRVVRSSVVDGEWETASRPTQTRWRCGISKEFCTASERWRVGCALQTVGFEPPRGCQRLERGRLQGRIECHSGLPTGEQQQPVATACGLEESVDIVELSSGGSAFHYCTESSTDCS